MLYRQKIYPLTKASELSKKKKESLFKELVDILDLAIREGGSTISDYVHADWWRRKYAKFPPDLW